MFDIVHLLTDSVLCYNLDYAKAIKMWNSIPNKGAYIIVKVLTR